MAEADLTGEAHQQVQAEAGDCEDKDQGRDAIVIGGRKRQRQHQYDRGERDEGNQAVSLQQSSSIEEREHAHTRSTFALPKRPCGKANSTARMTRNATASL